MCRYAQYSYKPHLACFACQKVFRRRHARDVGHHGPDKPAVCPECAGPVANMGLDFKAPARDDDKAWALAAELWTIGETWHSCGCNGPGYRPRDMPAFLEFLRERHAEYLVILRRWIDDPAMGTAEQRDKATLTWRERIERIEAAMRRHGIDLTPLRT